MYGLPVYDTLITPISADMLQDGQIREDVLSLLNGERQDSLEEYKVSKLRVKGRFLSNSHYNGSRNFYMSFSESLRKTKEKHRFQTVCPYSSPFMADISYIHMKFNLIFTAHSLGSLNKEIVSMFGGKSITCVVRSFITKDKLKNYLCLTLENEGKKLQYVLITKKGGFYECVVNKST
jgi:hypothetical protein